MTTIAPSNRLPFAEPDSIEIVKFGGEEDPLAAAEVVRYARNPNLTVFIVRHAEDSSAGIEGNSSSIATHIAAKYSVRPGVMVYIEDTAEGYSLRSFTIKEDPAWPFGRYWERDKVSLSDAAVAVMVELAAR